MMRVLVAAQVEQVLRVFLAQLLEALALLPELRRHHCGATLLCGDNAALASDHGGTGKHQRERRKPGHFAGHALGYAKRTLGSGMVLDEGCALRSAGGWLHGGGNLAAAIHSLALLRGLLLAPHTAQACQDHVQSTRSGLN